MSKSLYLVGSSLMLGIGAYAAYKYYKAKDLKSIDEGFEDLNKLEDNSIDKKILVLGLENSGKSTVINQLVGSSEKSVTPTEGFNVSSMQLKNVVYNIWEISGKENFRKHWMNFLVDTDVLIFVVDACDVHNLPVAVHELKNVVGDERMHHVPVIVVASKCHLPGAFSLAEVTEAIDVRSIESYKHKVKVLSTDSSILKKEIISMSQ